MEPSTTPPMLLTRCGTSSPSLRPQPPLRSSTLPTRGKTIRCSKPTGFVVGRVSPLRQLRTSLLESLARSTTALEGGCLYLLNPSLVDPSTPVVLRRDFALSGWITELRRRKSHGVQSVGLTISTGYRLKYQEGFLQNLAVSLEIVDPSPSEAIFFRLLGLVQFRADLISPARMSESLTIVSGNLTSPIEEFWTEVMSPRRIDMYRERTSLVLESLANRYTRYGIVKPLT